MRRAVFRHPALVGVLAIVAQAAAPDGPRHAGGTSSCVTADCHPGYRAVEHVHRPVGEGVCTICHRLTDAEPHTFRLAAPGAELCTRCHGELEGRQHAHHDLWRDGCTVCHDPHGTGFRFMLPAARTADACETCHAAVRHGDSDLHLPVVGESCTDCHDPHGATDGERRTEGAELCLRCHTATRGTLHATSGGRGSAAPGRCDECHVPHGADLDATLRAPVPDLCYGCHEQTRERTLTAKRTHAATSGPDWCLECHDPHAPAASFGLRSDPLTLCGSCHGVPITTEEGETLEAVSSLIAASRYPHGPARHGDCGGCHSIHGSDHSGLLVLAYPSDLYTPFDLETYALCFGCHPARSVLTPRTDDLTDFRNGDLNLHYLHVNKPENGRSCRACHATHASDAPKHIRDWLRFGQWKLPIRFTLTETGGSCISGCHKPRSYDRERPETYEPGQKGRPSS
ncbi:MAG: cytochrome c3 family protein [Planctomycetota bacterium]|jgi:predicted CXXCH cytochrome family protein